MTNKSQISKLKTVLSEGGVAVIPTDTIYGIVGLALNPKTVERIYSIKGRTPTKPFIILISDYEDLDLFGVKINSRNIKSLKGYWPGPVSIIIPCLNDKFEYLHRGTKTLAFRMPANVILRGLIEKTGPLVAPSANPEGLEPATNVIKAKEYFGDRVDYYFDGGEIIGEPSSLIDLTGNTKKILRGNP